MNDDNILIVDHLTMRFGGIVAVNDLSFAAGRRKITALIGPNGAGKTTVFNCVTGFYRPTGGTMRLTHDGGSEIALERLNDFRISKQAKVARTFQNIRLFPGMTASVRFVTAVRPNVIEIPSAALRFQPYGVKVERGVQTVYTLDAANQPVQHRVETGITDGRLFELTSGDLTEGTPVIVSEVRAPR